MPFSNGFETFEQPSIAVGVGNEVPTGDDWCSLYVVVVFTVI